MKSLILLACFAASLLLAEATIPIYLNKYSTHSLLALGTLFGAGYSLLGAGAILGGTKGRLLPRLYFPLPHVVHHHQPVISQEITQIEHQVPTIVKGGLW